MIQEADLGLVQQMVQNAAIFFNLRNFAVSVVHAIVIFILIKMHFGLLVSNNQVDRNHVIRIRF